MAPLRAVVISLSVAGGCTLVVDLPDAGGPPEPRSDDEGEPCGEASDCAVAADCVVPACVNGLCAELVAQEGTACDDGRRACDTMGICGLRVNGVACDADSECGSGECVDGVCCAAACDDLCMGCAVPGSEGECAPILLGDNAVNECTAPLRCNGLGACGGEHIASALYGGDAEDQGFGVTISASGDIAFTGRIDGAVSFGGATIGATGPANYFATRVDGDLVAQWVGGDALPVQPGIQLGTAACHDPEGNLYVVGSFTDQIQIGVAELASKGGSDAFVASYDVLGSPRWAIAIGGVDEDLGVSIAHDDLANRVIVVGTHGDSLTLGAFPLNAVGGTDVFVAALEDDSGVTHVADTIGSEGDDNVGQVVWDETLGIVIAATAAEDLYAGGVLIEVVDRSPVVVQLKSNLSVLSTQVVATEGSASGMGLAVDGTGAVVLVGSVQGAVSFGDHVIASVNTGLFYAKFRLTDQVFEHGAVLGPKSVLGAPLLVAVDEADGIVIAGSFVGTTDFGGGELVSVEEDILVLKLTSDGAYGWSRRFGGGGADRVLGLAISSQDDSIALVGAVTASVDFGGGLLNPAGTANAADIFALRIGP